MSKTKTKTKKGKSKIANIVEPSTPITLIAADDLIMPLYFLERERDQEYIMELASSIMDNGLIHPLIVKKVKTQYRILSGAHRFLAINTIGWEKIPCRIIKATKAGELMMTLSENINRRDVNPVDLAKLIVELQAREKLTQEQIAERFGKSQPWVASKIKLLKTTETVQEKVKVGDLSEGHAVEIAKLPTEEDQDAAVAIIEMRDLSVHKTRDMVETYEEEKTLHPEAKAQEIAEKTTVAIDEPTMVPCAVGNHDVAMSDYVIVRLCPEHFDMLKQLFMKEGEEFFPI